MEELSNSKKKAFPEQLLEDSEARYNLLIDSVKDYAIFMLDPQGYIMTWNSGAEKIKGYTKDEILHRHFSIFYTEDALGRNHPANILILASEEGTFEETDWRVKKDGTYFWANVVISAMYDQNKKLIGFSKVTRDLTERKNLEDKLIKANEELKESEERSRLLIAGVKDYAIFFLTPEGNIGSWNEGAKRLKGYEAEEIIGQHFSNFYPPESMAAQYPQFELRQALEKGRFEDEGWRVRKNGTLFWANVVITPVYNKENKHLGFTKITRDLSEKVRNDVLMKKNLELHRINTDLDNFVYTASHDLKAPIANLEGLLSLMESKISAKLDEPERKILQLMGNSIMKLNTTIESLVEITKTQKNLDAKVETVPFREILADVQEDLASDIASTGAEIREAFEVKELRFAKASLRSIMYNLLSNAIKYRSPDRLPLIEIKSFKEGKKTVLSIKDNGLGLTKAQEAKLFTMFRRFHSHVEGTGIGLYIVKRTMENNEGKIKVHSRPNKGTEFKLYFNSLLTPGN